MKTCGTVEVRAALLLLLLAWLVGGVGRAAHADHDIVYAATCYRWSGHLYKSEYGDRPQRTLEDTGPSHLFRINPDGTGRTQLSPRSKSSSVSEHLIERTNTEVEFEQRLTFSHYDDTAPRFAPDGRRILFLRQEGGNLHSLCLIEAAGGAVTTLAHFPPKQSYEEAVRGMHAQWSPDGRVAGYIHDTTLHLLDLATRHERVFADVEEYAWSPDSRRLYLAAGKNSRIADLQTGKITPLSTPILCPLWIDATRILGTFVPPDSAGGIQEQITACVLGRDGKARRRTLLDNSTGGDYGRDNIWHTTRPGSPLYVVEGHHHMSDGDHPACVLVNIITGHVTDLDTGSFIAMSPDGKQCLIAENEWVGPYKRGGRRGGPLNVVEIFGKNVTDITSKLMTVTDGDWRKPLSPNAAPIRSKPAVSNRAGKSGTTPRLNPGAEHEVALQLSVIKSAR